jgi:hypothetical protein
MMNVNGTAQKKTVVWLEYMLQVYTSMSGILDHEPILKLDLVSLHDLRL